MELTGFKDFTRLNESQLDYYSMEFGPSEQFIEGINSRFEKKLDEILTQRISPFLHDVRKISPKEFEVDIKINPNDFFSEIVSRDQISVRIPLPTSSLIRTREQVNPKSIIASFSSLKYYGSGYKSTAFVDERKDSYITKMSFSVDPTLFSNAKRDAAFLLAATDSNMTLQDLTDFDSTQVYEVFMADSINKEKVDEFTNTLISLVRYETLLDLFEESMVPLVKKDLPLDRIDRAIETASSSSPEKEDLRSMQEILKILMIESEKGRRDRAKSSYLLSKLMGALIDNYGSSKEIKRVLASSRYS